jgi:UDP-4-amino-4,6-dideoxy-N-acetyl-beta-L-altrosamine transaminase
MKRIPYGRHYISPEDIEEVSRTLNADFITQGPRVEEFEKAFASYIGSEYAVAVNNGTAALDICVKAMELNPGEKVITSPVTFVASANCVRFSGGEVLFADIDDKTILIDIDKIENLILEHPEGSLKGIIPVDFAGQPVNMEAIRKLADKYNLWIVEDSCHAPGGAFTDSLDVSQKCGNGKFADLAIFSFHPVKHIATGEGGMVTTNNKQIYQRLLKLRNHGITKEPEQLMDNHGGWYYEMQELSHNFRLTDFQAALGISQLKRAAENLAIRNQLALNYDNAFENLDLIRTPERIKGNYHAFHLYVIRAAERKKLYDYLVSKGIFAQIHYIPVHLMPYYRNLGWKKGDFPVAEKYYEECISLPLYPTLSSDEQQYVIDTVFSFYKG